MSVLSVFFVIYANSVSSSPLVEKYRECHQSLCANTSILNLAKMIEPKVKDTDCQKTVEKRYLELETLTLKAVTYYQNAIKQAGELFLRDHYKVNIVDLMLNEIQIKCDNTKPFDERITFVNDYELDLKSLKYQQEIENLEKWITKNPFDALPVLYPCGFFKATEFDDVVLKIAPIVTRINDPIKAREAWQKSLGRDIIEQDITDSLNRYHEEMFTNIYDPIVFNENLTKSFNQNAYNEFAKKASFNLNELSKNIHKSFEIIKTSSLALCLDSKSLQTNTKFLEKYKGEYLNKLIKLLDIEEDRASLTNVFSKVIIDIRQDMNFSIENIEADALTKYEIGQLEINSPVIRTIIDAIMTGEKWNDDMNMSIANMFAMSTLLADQVAPPHDYDNDTDNSIITAGIMTLLASEFNDYGIFAHELSHVVDYVFSEQLNQGSVNFNTKFTAINQCLATIHPNNNSNYVREDFADMIAALIEPAGLNLFLCNSINEDDLILDNKIEQDPHSSVFFRLIHTNYIRGIYPSSCKEVMDLNSSYSLKKCI